MGADGRGFALGRTSYMTTPAASSGTYGPCAYASMAISAGMSAPELARVLGHKSAAFTFKWYVHFFERGGPPSVHPGRVDRLRGARGGQAGGTTSPSGLGRGEPN